MSIHPHQAIRPRVSTLWPRQGTPRKVILPREEYEGEPADDVSQAIPVVISIMEVTAVHEGLRVVLTWASAFRRGLGMMSVRRAHVRRPR